MRKQVVLPQPDGPSSTQNVPARTVNDTSDSAAVTPQLRVTPVNRTAAPSGAGGLAIMVRF